MPTIYLDDTQSQPYTKSILFCTPASLFTFPVCVLSYVDVTASFAHLSLSICPSIAGNLPISNKDLPPWILDDPDMTLTNQYVLPYHFCDVTDSLYRPLRPPTTLRSPFPRLDPLFNLPPDRWFTPCEPHLAGLRLHPLIQRRHLSNPRSRYHRGGRYLCRHELLVYTHHELTDTLKISKARFIFQNRASSRQCAKQLPPSKSHIPPLRP